ncbi:hypothetical protein COCOBI_08-0900 [Coccomyxa sp. Obi]|nr:hypothetical protein COCOBI_08-0900 [Coccomyxa sp. Obi]
MVKFLDTVRNVWEQPAEGKTLKQRSASSRAGSNRAASIHIPSGAPANGTEVNSAGALASIEPASSAMQFFGQLLEELLPAGGESQHKLLDVLTDGGQKRGTATLAGPDAVFHNRRIWPEFAVVGQLSITDEAAAQSQMAWMSDTAETSEGVTPVSANFPGSMIAVPLRCLRLGVEPPTMAAPSQHLSTSGALAVSHSGLKEI